MDAEAIPKILFALLKHRAKKALGEEAVGILADEFVDLGEGEISKRLEDWLGDQTIKRKLEEASEKAVTCFLQEDIDDELKQWMVGLPFDDLPKLQTAMGQLPDQLDEQSLEDAIRRAIDRDWEKLDKKQKDEAASAYLTCINKALGTIDAFRPTVIVQAVLRIEEKVDKTYEGVQELLSREPSQPDQPPFPEYTPPKLPKPDELPEPGLLPPGSRMPFTRNAVFTGREDDLRALAERLLIKPTEEGVGISEATAATGMGGLGKTQLAVELCYRYGRYFQGVHWLRASEDLAAEIAACGAEMRLRPWPETVPEQVQLTLAAWVSGGPRLVVLDNVEGPKVLREWLPKLGGVRLLMTSRQAVWPKELGIATHALETFTRPQSVELLRKLAARLNDLPDEDVEAVAERLGDLPLALDLAGRYLNDLTELSPAGYLIELKKTGGALEHTSLLDWVEGSPTDVETNLAASFMLSWQRLDGRKKVDKLARKLFTAAGYCAPNVPIPRAIFVEMLKEEEKKPEQAVAMALKRLGELGLLTLAEGDPTIHPLMGEFGQTQDDEQKSVLSSLANALALRSVVLAKTGLPSEFLPISPHVGVVAEISENNGIEDAGILWNSLGNHLDNVAEFAEARVAFENALKIAEENYGRFHISVAIRLNNLGEVLRSIGKMVEAQAASERALNIVEKVYGKDHPQTAPPLNNLGLLAFGMGKYEVARDYHQRALEINLKVLGKKNPRVAKDFNNLGIVYKYLGDLVGSQVAYESAIAIGEAVYGEEHPQVAIYVNNLGSVLMELGELGEAQAAIERAIRIDVVIYGPEHPAVARDVNNLGRVLRELGDLAGAKIHYERALRIFKQFLPAGHPDIETVRANLAVVEEEMKK